jgi:ABC-type bacteriocin/lantibiotic exporter with double-glycine peptidase domain
LLIASFFLQIFALVSRLIFQVVIDKVLGRRPCGWLGWL